MMGKAGKAVDSVAGWLEDHEEHRREQGRTILRALNTGAGMAALGAVLLFAAAVVFINGRVEARQPVASDGLSISVSGLDGGGNVIFATEEGVIAEAEPGEVYELSEWLQEQIEQEARERERRRTVIMVGSIVSIVCGTASWVYAAYLLTKKKKKTGDERDAGTIPAESASMEAEAAGDIPTPVENTDSRAARRRNLEQLYKAGLLSKEEYRQRMEKL